MVDMLYDVIEREDLLNVRPGELADRPASTKPLQVDRWLHQRRCAPDLTDQLRCVWHGELGDAGTPLPDERLDLVWVDDGSMWLSGPETRSWSRGYPSGTTAVGVGFRPGIGPPVFHLAASEIRDARIRLEELWGERDARELAERIAHQPGDRGRTLVLEGAVRRLVANARPVDGLALEVAARLNRPRPPSMRDLTRSTGLSERQIHRRCTAAFGYGPAVLVRLLRVQRFLQLARCRRPPLQLADLSAAAGYSDQQHLTHEVRRIFGTTPTTLVRTS